MLTRVNEIDLLRFIGLAMIVLAHVGPPGIFLQLRNFDVPLMVLISGMAFGLTFKNERYGKYVWKRIKRLLFPVWIFLTLYFSSLLVINPSSDDLDITKVLTSYSLISGIGYVWIIRVFLLVALVSPFIYQFHKSTDSNGRYLLTLVAVLSVYELCRYLAMPYIAEGRHQLLTMIIYYIVPYSLLFAFGLRIPRLSRTLISRLVIVFSACFVIIGGTLWFLNGSFVPTQLYKYPPSIYYLSYAIAVSLFIWLTSGYFWSILEKLTPLKRMILFIAQNSIWIYLWHIPLVKNIHAGFLYKYLLVFSLATLITYCQVLFVKKVLIEKTSSLVLKRDFRMLLTG